MKKVDHKTMDQTSHKGQFLEMYMYTSSESWINKLSIDVWFECDNIWPRYNYLKIWYKKKYIKIRFRF